MSSYGAAEMKFAAHAVANLNFLIFAVVAVELMAGELIAAVVVVDFAVELAQKKSVGLPQFLG